jgi:hypothetical protein
MTGDDFRRMLLAMQGVIEASHMGHPDFRANGRIFASLDGQETRGVLRLSPEEQRALLVTKAPGFEPAPGAWGGQGWTRVDLGLADEAAIRSGVVLAWEWAMSGRRGRSRRLSAGAVRRRR